MTSEDEGYILKLLEKLDQRLEKLDERLEKTSQTFVPRDAWEQRNQYHGERIGSIEQQMIKLQTEHDGAVEKIYTRFETDRKEREAAEKARQAADAARATEKRTGLLYPVLSGAVLGVFLTSLTVLATYL